MRTGGVIQLRAVRPLPLSSSSNDHYGGFADAKQFRLGIVDEHADRISGGQVDPVEGSLRIRQTTLEGAKHIGIRRYPEADAVNGSGKTAARTGHHINVSPHALLDALEFALSKVPDSPPPARINQNEHLLADMGVSAFGDCEIGDARFEGRINFAVIEII